MNIRKIIKEEIDDFDSWEHNTDDFGWAEDHVADIHLGMCVQREELNWSVNPPSRHMVQYTITNIIDDKVILISPLWGDTQWNREIILRNLGTGEMVLCQK